MSGSEWRSNYDASYGSDAASPEKRLWLAVMEKTVHDFRLKIKHAQRDLARRGRVSPGTLWDLKSIRYEMKSEWFWEMASYAGMDSGKIIRFLDNEALQQVGVDLTVAVLNPTKTGKPDQ